MPQHTARKIYDPVGRCIYCGSTTYLPGGGGPPHTEHVIPFSLSGGLELPEASCRRCERAVNPWETKLIRGALLGCRTHLGLDTRNPKDRPKALTLIDPRTTPERKVKVPIEDYPANLLLVQFDTPHIISGVIFDSHVVGVWSHWFKDVAETLATKYGLDVFTTTSIDVYALCKTLAKIAHAYAVAELGIGAFTHMLPHYIVGGYDEWATYYVGGLPSIEPLGSTLHEIGIETPTTETWRYVVVRIRFFANVGAPTYRVVAGERINPATPLDVHLEQAGVLRNVGRTRSALRIRPPIPVGPWGPAAPSADGVPAPFPTQWFRAKSEYPRRQ